MQQHVAGKTNSMLYSVTLWIAWLFTKMTIAWSCVRYQLETSTVSCEKTMKTSFDYQLDGGDYSNEGDGHDHV